METTQRIRQSLDLATIFNTAVEEIRQLINVDRVAIFKFDPDINFNNGEFVSESVVGGFKSALETKIHDHCFDEQYAIYYQQGRMQVVDDIDNAGITDCHHDVLAQFQIRANLIRTPLAIISSSTGILQNFSDRLSPEKKQAHPEIIQKTIKHTVQLLDDVLMINRAEAEKMEFKPEALDIIGFCRHLKNEIEATSSKHTINFSLNTSEPTLNDIVVVQFDPKLIRQILTNLLSNAIKYSPENSSVDFRLHIEHDQLIFKIKDSGIGIPEKDQINLFGSFYRASNVGSISSTGLGLAIVKKCVDQHQGEITLNSEVHKGTTFTVRIPLL